MIIKDGSPTMRHVSRTHRVALDWLFDRINLDSKIQIKYIDTKNQLADILTKGNFTRDEWNHLLNLFNNSHFSSTACIAAMAKKSSTRIRRRTSHSKIKTYDESNSEDAIGRVVFNFIKPGEDIVRISRSWEICCGGMIDQGKPDRLSPTCYSKMDYGRSWSSQEWKSEATAHDRSGKPEKTSWDAMQQVRPHHEEPLLDGLCAIRKVRRERKR